MFLYLSLLFLQSMVVHNGNVHVETVFVLATNRHRTPVVLLEEDSVEVPGLGKVVLVTAPARRPLKVHHDLLQLPLNHRDPRADGEKNNQSGE